MPWPVTIDGKTWKSTDFTPYSHATNLPTIVQNIANVAKANYGPFESLKDFGDRLAPGAITSVNKRARAITGAVAVDPRDASPVLATKGQRYTPDIVLDGTFTRASAAAYFDPARVLRSAATGLPRYDTDPTTGEYLGIMFESSRTNSLTFSQDFTGPAWTRNLVVVTADATTAPDGTLTADRFVSNAGSFGNLQRSVSVTAASTYTASIFFKAGEITQANVLVPNVNFASGNNRIATFNLTDKTAVVSGAVGTEAQAFIKELPNGWFRCSLTFTPDVTGSALIQFYRGVDTSDGTSGLFAWGAQFETGYTTSYVATTTAAVTRQAEYLIHSPGDWFNPREGTFFYQAMSLGAANGFQLIGGLVNDAAPDPLNMVYMEFNNANQMRVNSRVANVTTGLTSAVLSGGKGVLHRMAFAYAANDLAMSVDGAAAVTAAATIPTGMDRWHLGSSPSSPTSSGLFGSIYEAFYFPRRLPNATLQRMTA